MDLAKVDWRVHRGHGNHGNGGICRLEPAGAGAGAPARAFARGAAVGIFADHRNPRGTTGQLIRAHVSMGVPAENLSSLPSRIPYRRAGFEVASTPYTYSRTC